VCTHDFKRYRLAELARRKLAAAEREAMMAGRKAVEVVRMRITAAGGRGWLAGALRCGRCAGTERQRQHRAAKALLRIAFACGRC